MDWESKSTTRRQVLGLLGGLGAAVVVGGCGGGDGSASGARRTTSTTAPSASTSTTSAASATTAATAATLASCTKIPQETAGPYPGDGTNGPNALTVNGIVRSDIRPSVGGGSITSQGVPLTIKLTVVDASNGCRPRAGAAVYLWHCDAVGRYSMYTQGVTNENFCRGVQSPDANGNLTFTSVFPGAYSGRYPHIHFEIFTNAASATSGANKIGVSQLALPEDVCRTVYATNGYTGSASNLTQTPITRDNVFSDGFSQQMATTTGSTTAGYTATLVVAS